MGALNGAAAGATRKALGRMRHLPRPGHDPLAGVLSMGPRIPVSVLIAFTIVFHAGVAGAASAAALFSEIFAWNRAIKEAVVFKLAQSYDVEVEKEKEKEKEKEPEPPPPVEKEEPKPVVKEATPPPKPDEPPPPPAAAEAAKVLTADPDPNEPVDMTNTIVQGNADKYAGGQSASTGTSKTAVHNLAASPTGVVGGTGAQNNPPGPPKQSRARKAGLLGSSDWTDCPFPAEADAEQIDQAFVLLQVRVKPDGNPETVTVLQDPGHGFGREARKCAMRKKYQSELDFDGNPLAGQTNPFRVRFER